MEKTGMKQGETLGESLLSMWRCQSCPTHLSNCKITQSFLGSQASVIPEEKRYRGYTHSFFSLKPVLEAERESPSSLSGGAGGGTI